MENKITISKKNKFLYILPILLLFCYSGVVAQISVTQTSFEQTFSSELTTTQDLSEDSDNIAPLIELDGANQTWDFSDLEFQGGIEGTMTLVDNDGSAPGGGQEHFQQADFVLEFDIEVFDDPSEDMEDFTFEGIYSYVSLDDDGMALSFGEVATIEGSDNEFLNIIRPARIDYVFPLNFNDSWNYEFEEETIAMGFSSTSDFEVIVEADAWGQVITPTNTHDVLRLKITRTATGDTQFEEVSYEFVDQNGLTVAVIDEDDSSDEITASVHSYSIATSSESEPEIAQTIKLNQNYPNPFNPSTVISFELPESSNVTLEVFDVTGRKVAELMNGHRNAGTHEITFDADQLSSGVYMYRLKADGVSLTRSLTLIE